MQGEEASASKRTPPHCLWRMAFEIQLHVYFWVPSPQLPVAGPRLARVSVPSAWLIGVSPRETSSGVHPEEEHKCPPETSPSLGLGTADGLTTPY